VQAPQELESTSLLLERLRRGESVARDLLLARYLPVLRRWAHGRLPPHARGLSDTDDLVQITLMRALERLPDFEARREGAFLAYLRQALLNVLRNEIRNAARRPSGAPIDERVPDRDPSPLEEAIGRDLLDRYEAALAALAEEQEEAVILRIEMGYSHEQIAEALGKSSANTARMVVARALLKLAETIGDRNAAG
jgi:RNA polymerase sigma-70 factor (ECF subfamily)